MLYAIAKQLNQNSKSCKNIWNEIFSHKLQLYIFLCTCLYFILYILLFIIFIFFFQKLQYDELINDSLCKIITSNLIFISCVISIKKCFWKTCWQLSFIFTVNFYYVNFNMSVRDYLKMYKIIFTYIYFI